MTAKQTPIEDIMRLYAEDLHSTSGHNRFSKALSQGADEIERIRSNAVALEDEKNTYMDYVGDALGQDDNETLWDAAQRVLSDRDRLRAELTEVRNPDCRTCEFVSRNEWGGLECGYYHLGREYECVCGSKYEPSTPIRLYSTDSRKGEGE
jgi:hypothetical protein